MQRPPQTTITGELIPERAMRSSSPTISTTSWIHHDGQGPEIVKNAPREVDRQRIKCFLRLLSYFLDLCSRVQGQQAAY